MNWKFWKKDISEPVFAIVDSLQQKGRWKIIWDSDSALLVTHLLRGRYEFSAVDTATGEKYTLESETRIVLNYRVSFPDDLVLSSLPTWMTADEKEYVKDVFDNISADVEGRMILIKDRSISRSGKRAKVNQDKERNRLKELYK